MTERTMETAGALRDYLNELESEQHHDLSTMWLEDEDGVNGVVVRVISRALTDGSEVFDMTFTSAYRALNGDE